MMCRGLSVLFFDCLIQRSRAEASDSEQRTSRYFESIRQQPRFCWPSCVTCRKAAICTTTSSGALYAENLIDYAARDNLCVDRTTSILIAPPCDDSCDRYTSKPAIRCAYGDQVLYNSIIDAWSMRNWDRRRVRPRPFLCDLRQVLAGHCSTTSGTPSPKPRRVRPPTTCNTWN